MVVVAGSAERGDHGADPVGLRMAELAVLEIDVVDDLGDPLERRVRPIQSTQRFAQQHLEGAAVALMGELGLEHVEAQLARQRAVALATGRT